MHPEPQSTTSRRGFFALGAAMAAGLSGLTACSSTSKSSSSVSASSSRIVVKDLTGAEVVLPKPARRVVTIPIPAASMIVAVSGKPETVVGMNPSARTAIEKGFLGEIHPSLLTVPSDVANQNFVPNVESILASKPDLIIQWGDEGAGLVEPLKATKIPVAQLLYGTQERLEGAISMYGKLLAAEDRAQRILDLMQKAQKRMKELPSPSSKQPSVLYVRGTKGSFDAAGKASYNDFTIRIAGARNVAESIPGHKSTVNVEQLLSWQPDVILLGNFGPATPKDLYDDPQLASLEAVKNRRVYKVPLGGYRWDPPNQESHLMWEWLAALVRGDNASGLRSRIKEDLAFLYGTAPTDSQVETILQMKANANSHGYAEFGK